MVTALLTACLGPTFISYKPMKLSWDDADYLARAVAVSRAFWSGDVHGLGAAMVSVHTPIMTFLGFPWGPLRSSSNVGNCFFALTAVIASLAAVCLYMLLRIGVKPFYLIFASLCVGLSLGPYTAAVHVDTIAHSIATGFYADNLLAWLAFAAVLLIPFEARTPRLSIRSAVLRGILCAAVFSLGALTKVSFFYFIVLIIPVLLFMRFHSNGIRSMLAWLLALVCGSAPAAIFFLRYGQTPLANAKAASFGGLAGFYHVPQWQFLAGMVQDSPGLAISFLLLAAASVYLLIKQRPGLLDADFIACLIVVGFVVVVLASPSKHIRYLYPAIVALPFLMSILLSSKEDSVRPRWAALAATVAFLILVGVAVPTRHRTYRQNLTRAEAILAEAAQSNAKSIVLATDSPTLNVYLLRLTSEFSSSGISIGTLAYQAISGVPIEDDLRTMSETDMVIFQDPRHTNPKFTNQRVPQYETYAQRMGAGRVRIGDDMEMYLMRTPSTSGIRNKPDTYPVSVVGTD
jgi:hypothetical protein